MPFDYRTLIRPDVLATPLEPWTNSIEAASERLGIPVDRLAKMDSNENLYGPSPKVREALAGFTRHYLYPDPLYVKLRAALAKHTGATPERIIVGNGLDEVIDLVMRVLLSPGDGIVDCPPSFEVYGWQAGINHARVVSVPRRADFSLDCEAVEQAVLADSRVKLIWLTSPNNPDGSLLPRADLTRLLRLPVFVAVDEAYVDFAPESHMGLTGESPNLIVLRTFSKGPGLAGLRLGYGVFPRSLADNLWKIVMPFSVNALAVAAGIAALDDWDYTRRTAAKIVEEREKVFEELHTFGFLKPHRSHGCFILCEVIGRSARALQEALARLGVLVRLVDNPHARNCLRITIGTPRETAMLVDALQRVG
ncbi:MAG: histidinol-phosphate transaminase [Chloroflexi bacterium]|nr:histidinol-phosphate transaminase [Chloroflexota bacterium]